MKLCFFFSFFSSKELLNNSYILISILPIFSVHLSGHDPSLMQIPIQNTGSLPDLTNVDITSPIHIPLDQDHNSSPYSSVSNTIILFVYLYLRILKKIYDSEFNNNISVLYPLNK